jgi:integrase
MARRTRRAHGEGSIYKRGDSYFGQVSLGEDPITGKRIRRTFSGSTKKAVAAKMRKARAEWKKRGNQTIDPAKVTLGQWLDKWLEEYKRPQIKHYTFATYEMLIRVHIKPALGDVALAKLQPHMLQAFYNEKLESGRQDGTGGLSTKTVRHMYAIISQALRQGVQEGFLLRNVADATNPPTVKTKPMEPLTEEQLQIFFNSAKDDRYFPGYLLAATTGMRRGELCGLCWDSVDLKEGVVIVQRQMTVLKEGLSLDDTTKSRAGRRSVVLTDDAVRELKAHRRRQLEERLLMGEAYRDQGLVFCKEDGTPTDPREFTKRFQRLLRAAGLPKVRLHDLRHTHASLLLSRGMHPKIVQERLGHSSITMTLDLYSHLAPGLDRQAAESLNGLMQTTKEKEVR